MTDSSLNPYRSPVATDRSHEPRPAAVALARSLAGTAMTLLIAIVLWALIVAFLDRLVPPTFDMVLWSASLLVSLALSAFIIARTERFRPHLLHLGLAAIAAIAVYGWIEGGTPNAGSSLHAVLFYLTASLTPVTLVVSVALTPKQSPSNPYSGVRQSDLPR